MVKQDRYPPKLPRSLRAKAAWSGIHLFYFCQWLAQQSTPWNNGSGPLSGSSIFYYTRLVLFHQGMIRRLELDTRSVPRLVALAFLRTSPVVAERLSADFARALSILAKPTPLLRWRAVGAWLNDAPEFHHCVEQVMGKVWHKPPIWPLVWERFWKETEQEYAARMAVYLRPERLRITVVAPAGDDARKALQCLQRRLRQEQAIGWESSVLAMYMYQEPLIEWVMHPLREGGWVARFVQRLLITGAPYPMDGTAD